MKSATVEEGIKFHLLKTTWSVETLFVAGAGVAGRGLALGLGLGAFQNNNIAWHNLKKSEIGTRNL